jgi:hypothetical protein
MAIVKDDRQIGFGFFSMFDDVDAFLVSTVHPEP